MCFTLLWSDVRNIQIKEKSSSLDLDLFLISGLQYSWFLVVPLIQNESSGCLHNFIFLVM
jgi:hypothetical protein